jgi:glycosyltransferase involved in cell wall biosynthesis
MKVAAVIPTRNRASTIGMAIKSAIDQTYPLSEIIVIDDGSTDNTIEIINSFPDPRIRLIQQKHLGACAARNAGWRSSDAEWIGFLDSDDIWMAEKTEYQLKYCDPGVSACFTGFRERRGGVRLDSNTTDQFNSMIQLEMGNGIGPTSICLIRRSSLVEIDGWDESLPSCQDWDLWLKLSRVGELKILPAFMSEIGKDNADRISNNIEAIRAGHQIVFDRVLSGADPSKRRLIAAMHAIRMWYMLSAVGKRKEALYFALKSIAIRPNIHALELIARSFQS